MKPTKLAMLFARNTNYSRGGNMLKKRRLTTFGNPPRRDTIEEMGGTRKSAEK